ncbi:hypothetical protein, partial [Streptomyces hirsutus]|uniref:hypothetical protein n=1 Tax=Streptomyces hirsutus TaxID=35620 RepID=UPI0012FF27B5
MGTAFASLPVQAVVACVLAMLIPSVLEYAAHRYETRRRFDFANALLDSRGALPEPDRVALSCHLAQALFHGTAPPSPSVLRQR